MCLYDLSMSDAQRQNVYSRKNICMTLLLSIKRENGFFSGQPYLCTTM